MVNLTQLEKFKLKVGSGVSDDLLQVYLDDAQETILDLSNLDVIPDKLVSTQVELAIIYFNKQGIEGQTSHSEGGISRNFEDIPESIKKKIRAFRKLPR